MLKITYYGHSAMLLDNGQQKVIIDPFLRGNPHAKLDVAALKVDAILVTHAHADHLGDAIEISKNCQAPIIGPFELVNYCLEQGASGHPMHIGGSHQFPFGRVKLTIAHHGSATADGVYCGNPCGFVVEMGGKTIYHAGDTGLFYDMKLIGEMNALDLAILPIGDNFTMGIADALKASQLLSAKMVMPMHYQTFEVINADPENFVSLLKEEGSKTLLIPFNQTVEI